MLINVNAIVININSVNDIVININKYKCYNNLY